MPRNFGKALQHFDVFMSTMRATQDTAYDKAGVYHENF